MRAPSHSCKADGRDSCVQGIAVDFFNACEGGKGWNATRRYVSSSAPFHAQVTDALPGPKLSEVKTIKGYTEWMAGVVKEFGPKASCNPTKTTFPKPTSPTLFLLVLARRPSM